MSLRYDPDNGVLPDSHWQTVFLANRDVGGQVPINKIAWPAVSITAACFGDNVYDRYAFQTCFSNLLASKYRRFTIDLYWDAADTVFRLCPVAIPAAIENATSVSAQVESLSMPVSAMVGNVSLIQSARLMARQNSTLVTELSNSTTTNGAFTITPNPTTTASATFSVVTGEQGRDLIAIGPYQCSVNINLQSVIDVTNYYIRQTSDAVQATIMLLEFNLHAAASASDPTGQPITPSSASLPQSSNLVGSQLQDDLDRWMYTPSALIADRGNLNATWFSVQREENLPIVQYYNVFSTSSQNLATDDGWPNEHFLIFTENRRLLSAWGTVDDQMSGYDFRIDEDKIFPSGYLTTNHEIQANADGTLRSGCFYEQNVTNVDQVNTSWALTALDNANLAQQSDLLGNMTACGVSFLVNNTLDNTSADQNYTPYQQVARQFVVGWAPGEPRNVTSGDDDDDPANQYRCAVIDSRDAYRGHWRLENCQRRYHAACRVSRSPFQWRLSDDKVPFGSGPAACSKPDTDFGVPRTGLENTYLYNQILADAQSVRDPDFTSAVWINLNSLDEANCWVTTGPNGTCTYSQDETEQHNREVLIPTIAALIVLVLTVMTILVKCNINRRSSRTRRTGPGGWEYEGVPS